MVHGTVCSPREFQWHFRGKEFLKINHFEGSVTLNKNFLRSEEARFFNSKGDCCLKFAFLCIRYGWIPTSSEISQEIQEEYQWIFPVSITHMEIIHAAYRVHNQNAAFLIRSADFIKDLPPEMTRAFVDTHPLNKAQMKVSLIKEKCLQINHFHYGITLLL